MIRLFGFMPRRPDVSAETFHAHWKDVHGPLALHITSMRGYVQSHCVEGHPPQNRRVEIDGIAEVWFDDMETAAALRDNPQFTEYAALDEPNFIDMANLEFVIAHEASRTGGLPARDDADVKVLMFLRRDPALAPDAFAEGWRAADEDAEASAVGALRHARSITAPAFYAQGEPIYDGVRELWFSDRDAADAARERDPVAWAALAAPAGADPTSTSVVVVREHRVVWPDVPVPSLG